MTQTIFPSLKQNTLRVSALNAIRDNILNGVLKPGQPLVQAEIAAQMNVSRAPVREALRQLEEEGLVESIPYRGTFVSRVSRRDILELYSLRGTLEAMAVRLAIQRSGERDLADLEAIVARMAEAADAADYPALDAADIDFHTRICVLSRHRHLIRNWEINSQLIRRILSFRNKLNPPHVVVERHRPIMAAIQMRDTTRAQQAIEEHCVSSGEALAAAWADGSGEEDDYGLPEVSAIDAYPGR